MQKFENLRELSFCNSSDLNSRASDPKQSLTFDSQTRVQTLCEITPGITMKTFSFSSKVEWWSFDTGASEHFKATECLWKP